MNQDTAARALVAIISAIRGHSPEIAESIARELTKAQTEGQSPRVEWVSLDSFAPLIAAARGR